MKNPFTLTSPDAVRFLEEQLEEWPLARRNYEALARVRTRKLKVKGSNLILQHNPERIRSSAACVDEQSLQERPCFLCEANQPPEQRRLPFGDDYWLTVNPYPIFPQHFTIPTRRHTPQSIRERYPDMLYMARSLNEFVIFYNGPCCGASAPDHAHFQAGNKGFLPVETEWKRKTEPLWLWMAEGKGYASFLYNITALVWETTTVEDATDIFDYYYYWHQKYFQCEGEPMMNLLVWYEKKEKKWYTLGYYRKAHRPPCYYAEGEDKLLISPAAVDLGGVIVLPREEDYRKIKAKDIRQIMGEIGA